MFFVGLVLGLAVGAVVAWNWVSQPEWVKNLVSSPKE